MKLFELIFRSRTKKSKKLKLRQALKVSAIVPIYNAETTLLRAINSLLIQPEINEIILIEDGSSDKSLELCTQLASDYDIIKLFTHPDGKNRGAPASRNLGLQKITNIWVQFMDADDEILPGKVKRQLEKVNSNTSLVIGRFLKNEAKTKTNIDFIKDIWSGLLATRLGNTTSNLWNAEVIKKVGGWEESLLNVQEYHLMFEIFKLNDTVVFSQDFLTTIYHQPNSITNSSNNLTEKRNTYFQFRNLVREYLIANGKYSLKRQHYYNVCTGGMLEYHRPSFEVPFNSLYFSLYRGLKRIEIPLSKVF